ncbi:alpha/beta hydrolase [uncultured Psychroserpens sp.]|uniref:alpha/beta hydrolase family protein n=1 Tax=uncultured Psychroserpens sp. TaxID=255436 RepID=UPI0026078ED5|nr:alpha/beta hydrolase [uncultured Psychroserpens sp.]
MILKNHILYRKTKKPIVWDAFFKNNQSNKPIVIFCHGYKGFKDWGAWDLVAKRCSDENLFFIKFNFSHNGGTVENPIDFPDLEAFAENNYTKELDDLDAILNHILADDFQYRNEIDTTNITLIGHSRGGGISIIKASEDQRITKLVTWSSICDFGKRSATTGDLEQWKKHGVKYVLNGRTKQQMPHNFQFYKNFKANETRLDIESAIKRLHVPILIIHGDNDTSVKINEANALNEWNPKSQLEIIKGANHVFNTKHPWVEKNLSKEMMVVIDKTVPFLT